MHNIMDPCQVLAGRSSAGWESEIRQGGLNAMRRAKKLRPGVSAKLDHPQDWYPGWMIPKLDNGVVGRLTQPGKNSDHWGTHHRKGNNMIFSVLSQAVRGTAYFASFAASRTADNPAPLLSCCGTGRNPPHGAAMQHATEVQPSAASNAPSPTSGGPPSARSA